MLTLIRHLFSSWAWKMAWRDSRPVRWRLFIFSTSIIFGVAALAIIGSLRSNLSDAVGSQAKSLLGADFMVGSRQPFTADADDVFDKLGWFSWGIAMVVTDTTNPRRPSHKEIIPTTVSGRCRKTKNPASSGNEEAGL